MSPAFHDDVCVSVDQQQGLIEYHRAPPGISKRVMAQLLDPRAGRSVVSPAELEPMDHVQELAELPPQVWRSLSAALEAFPARERSADWDWNGRDGAVARVECFFPDRVEVIGVHCALTRERPHHLAFVRMLLEQTHALFPGHQDHLRVLRSYADEVM